MNGINQIKKQIFEILNVQSFRITPVALERMISAGNVSKKAVRSAIRSMISDGILQYTHHFSTTHLELNYCRPFLVSEHILLSPNSFRPVPDRNQVLIQIDHGDAFGAGDHPTTRLCLSGIDFLMNRLASRSEMASIKALDIGTGSGILVIAAVKLGAEKGWGIDIDPIALHEAQKNIILNGLGTKVILTSVPLDELDAPSFKIVMANLRPPTLRALMPIMMNVSDHPAYWVLSGFREQEFDSLLKKLNPQKTTILWRGVACSWMAAVLEMSSKS